MEVKVLICRTHRVFVKNKRGELKINNTTNILVFMVIKI